MPWLDPNQSKLFGGKQPSFGHDVESRFIPAPTGGWDAISPLSQMEPKYALVMDNIVPRPGWCELRGGYNTWVRPTNAAVETLMTYRPAGGAERLFMAAGPEIFEVSSFGTSSVAVDSLTSARWQYLNFTPAGGSSYLYLVNGVDAPLHFDGTVWANPAITGVNPNSLININMHKRRLWFIQRESTVAWYLASDAIQGEAFPFDLGAFMTKGGYLVAMGTWTIDGGNGPDDYAVFTTSRGQAIVYKGTDPANPNAWALVGTFNLPPVISRRCMGQLGSDLLIITLEGLLPASKALPFDPSGVRSVALTNRIQNAMLEIAQQSQNLFGWQVMTFPKESLLIMNIPVTEGQLQVQYVMNSITGAWCRFTGWNANCFEIFNESLFFGGNDGSVNLAYAGPTDLFSPIEARLKCAFNAFDDPGRTKYMSMVRPLMVADGLIIPRIAVDRDFEDTSAFAPVVVINPVGGLWDQSLWDVGNWAFDQISISNWLTIGAIGTFLSIKMDMAITTIEVQPVSVYFDEGTFDDAVFDGNGITSESGRGVPTLQINGFEAIMEFGGPI